MSETKNKYVCSKCDNAMTHSKDTLEFKDGKATHQMSLGTWRCKTHGKVACKRVKR